MRTISEQTTLIGVSELRTHLSKVVKQAKYTRVIVERHSKPLLVLLDPVEYKRMDDMLEHLSDILLALEARVRELSKKNNSVPLQTARKYFLK